MDALPLSPPAQDEASAQQIRRLEAALAEARGRLSEFLKISSDWLWETDASLVFTHFDGRLEAATGARPDRWLGRTPMELAVISGEAAAPPPGFADMLAHAPFHDLNLVVVTPRGRRYISLSGKPRFDDSGGFAGYRGIGSDNTVSTEAEKRAAATHRRFAEAIECIPASLLLCDADDRIVICNSATQRYFPKVAHLLVPGTRFEDLVRAQAESGFLPEVDGQVDHWLEERMRRHRAADRTLTRRYEDGRWSQIIERRTSEGGVIGIRLDVTELKQREQALSAQAQQIAAYTADLERSNRDLEQFAYIASHDLQEPLRMVASYCQLLQRRYKGKLDDDADTFIGYAVEGANRMQRLINDLLGYSRLGRRGASPEPFPAGEAVAAAIANLQAAIEESGTSVTVGELPVVAGDRSQIIQLFQNLIGNAIKFRGDMAPAVRVEACAYREDGDTGAGRKLRFSIVDNGIGIDPDYRERVFLIFQRLHERGKYAGTGIGLAVAKKVVENHGGRIWTDAAPGGGSRFHFTLPAMPAAEMT